MIEKLFSFRRHIRTHEIMFLFCRGGWNEKWFQMYQNGTRFVLVWGERKRKTRSYWWYDFLGSKQWNNIKQCYKRRAAAAFIAKLFAKINVSKKYLLSIFLLSVLLFIFCFRWFLPFAKQNSPAQVSSFKHNLVRVVSKNDLSILLIKIWRHSLNGSVDFTERKVHVNFLPCLWFNFLCHFINFLQSSPATRVCN